MKVLVAGTFSSGKTTLISDIANTGSGFVIAPEGPRRVLQHCSNAVLGTTDVRSYLIVNQLLVEWESPNSTHDVLYEGGVVNNLAHDLVLLDPAPDRSALLREIGHEPYGCVFICAYEDIPLEDDGRRFESEELRATLHAATVETCNQMGYKVILLSGDRETRLARALNTIRGSGFASHLGREQAAIA